MPDKIAISHSEIKAWQTCRRRWYLAYYRALQLKDEIPSGVVHIGAHIHLALEGMHGYGLDPLAVLRWSYHDVITQQPEHEKALLKDLDMALAMTEGYVQWSEENGIDAGVEVAATEHEITHEVQLPNGGVIVLRGKLDVLLKKKSTGQLQVRDYKTVGSFDKAKLLLLDQQMRFYAMLLAFAFPGPETRSPEVLYLMIKRSKRTQRATPPFFAQETVTHNVHDMNSTYLRAVSVSSEIVNARQKLDGVILGKHYTDHRYVTPPNVTDFCSWGCPFLKICPMADSGDRFEDAIRDLYRVGEPYAYYDTSRIQRAVAALT